MNSVITKLKKLINGSKPTQQEINKQQKEQQAKTRERADEVLAILMETSFMEMPALVANPEKEEIYRELSQALQTALYDAPVMRLDTTEIDKHMKFAADCFKQAIINGDVYTADKSLMVLTNAITEIRQDVPIIHMATLDKEVKSKNFAMETYGNVLNLCNERFDAEKRLNTVREDMEISKEKTIALVTEIRETMALHPEYKAELDRANGKTVRNEGAMQLEQKLKAAENEKKNFQVLQGQEEVLTNSITQSENGIQSLLSGLPFAQFNLDREMTQELKELNAQWVNHFDEIVKIMAERDETISANWSNMINAINNARKQNQTNHAINFWREHEEEVLEELKSQRDALLNAQKTNSSGGQAEALRAEIKQLQELQQEIYNESKNENTVDSANEVENENGNDLLN